MSKCPWYVTALAVDRFAALLGRPAARGTSEWDILSDELVEQCALIWGRYERNQDLAPRTTRTGAYQYRGPGPLRLSVIVSMERRPEGPKPQVVDVTSIDGKRPKRGAGILG